MFLTRGFIFSYEAVRDWEAKLTLALAENLRRRRKGRLAPAGTSTEHISGAGADGGNRAIDRMAPWLTSC
jgi:hypothetical protein